MKRAISFILSVFLALGASGCGTPSRDNSVNMDSPEAELVLSRTDSKTVYGTEAPDPMAALQLDIPAGAQTAAEQTAAKAAPEELRAVWLTYINLGPMATGKTKAQFTASIDEAFGNIAAFGFNTVFAQVRPFGDALYDSDYFPWSHILSGTEGKNPGYDPLAIMCKLADDHNLRIEAWLNPYRVRTPNSGKPLAAGSQASKWLAAGNDGALEWNGGVYYNPGSAAARKLIVNGVKEIVTKYDVDGIHFDDYFYPTADMVFDAETYKASGSNQKQADWRRENVNLLVRDVYTAVKAIDPGCLFGISPQGNTKNNYDGQFADVAKWLSNKGYVDYICPQIYYGFDNGTNPYSATVDKWDDMIKVDGIDLYVGIAAYKLGVADEWAGAGKNEWVKTDGILADMVAGARGASRYGGVALYSYDSLFATSSAQVKAEKASLKKLFQ